MSELNVEVFDEIAINANNAMLKCLLPSESIFDRANIEFISWTKDNKIVAKLNNKLNGAGEYY